MPPDIEASVLKEKIIGQQEAIRLSYPKVWAATESVLKIVSYQEGKPLFQGSGVVVEGGRVLTACHIVSEADSLLLHTYVKGDKLTAPFSGKIILFNEDLSSKEARSKMREAGKRHDVIKAKEHQTAAALILQDYLDTV